MPVAFVCPKGHKRATPEANIGRRINCPECGSAVDVPAAANRPCYRTAQLITYNEDYQKVAKDIIFKEISRRIPGRTEGPPDIRGSYSILATDFGNERTAKIVIYQQDRGQGWKPFPVLTDGVYIFIRANGASAAGIWTKDMIEVRFPDLFALMSPEQTLGVVPQCKERFTYFRIQMPADKEARRAYVHRIIELLEACCRAC